jgi:hypothetical protein
MAVGFSCLISFLPFLCRSFNSCILTVDIWHQRLLNLATHSGNIVQMVTLSKSSSNIFPIHTLVFEKMCAVDVVCSSLGLNELMNEDVLKHLE